MGHSIEAFFKNSQKIFKGCIPQITLGSFVFTMFHMLHSSREIFKVFGLSFEAIHARSNNAKLTFYYEHV